MSDDMVARLRARTGPHMLLSNPPQTVPDALCAEAADEIERLRADLAATRAALQYARNLIGPDEIIDAALKGDGDE